MIHDAFVLPLHRSVPLAAFGLGILCSPIEAQAGKHAAAPPAVAWIARSADVQVLIDTGARELQVSGDLILRALAADGLGHVRLIVEAGAMRFDTLHSPSVRQVTFNKSRDTADLLLEGVPKRDDLVRVAFVAHNVGPLARTLGVRPRGAFASWGGSWYPLPSTGQDQEQTRYTAGRTVIRTPAGWRAHSNGVLLREDVDGDVRTTEWRVDGGVGRSFVAGPYVVHIDSSERLPVRVYLLPEHAAKGRSYAVALRQCLQIEEELFGAFPFASYAIVDLDASLTGGLWAGRSEQGYLLASSATFDRVRGVNWPVIAHELSHSWWGNAVLARSPGRDMVTEGLAGYTESLIMERVTGRAAGIEIMRDNVPGEYPSASAHGFFQLWREGLDGPLIADPDRSVVRAKAPYVWHMLRRRVGDSVFFASLRALARSKEAISLDDVRRVFVQHAPDRAAAFFADWIDRAGAPILRLITTSSPHAKRGHQQLHIRQLTAPYDLRIALRTRRGARITRDTIHLSKADQVFDIVTDASILAGDVDPDHELLLWEPAFGPINGITPAQSEPDLDRWLAGEIDWLRRIHNIPGTSGVVIERDKPALSFASGLLRDGDTAHVRSTTLFQVGGVSQLLTAATVLRLAERSVISLSDDAASRLTSWTAPFRPGTTILDVMRQTAGILPSTYPAYRDGEVIPSLAAVLTGQLPSRAQGIRQDSARAGRFIQSEGSFAVAEQVIEDVARQPFAATVRREVLEPLGLSATRFGSELTPAMGLLTAAPHAVDGTRLVGGARIYAVEAVRGAWSTAEDLGRLVAVLSASDPGPPTAWSTIRAALLTPYAATQWAFGPANAGLGLFVDERSGIRRYYLSGDNAGYIALLVGYPGTGRGVVILANQGANGPAFAVDVLQRIGYRYGWRAVPTWGK